jgi:hypothetical protein
LTVFVVMAVCAGEARGKDFAQPPVWPEEVESVFFDDAREALSGEPPTQGSAVRPDIVGAESAHPERAVWRELIAVSSLESAVKAAGNRIAQSVQQPARFKAGLHNDCRRDLTLLGTLFEVIAAYPDDIKWKSMAAQTSQLCLSIAESCAEGSDESLEQTTRALVALEELLRGQLQNDILPTEPLVPEFAPLMQFMEFVTEEQLPASLSKQAQFRRGAVSISEKAQLLAMLSQVIRREEYGYADDETYQAHADRLRDAAKELNDAAGAADFQKAVQAAASIQKSCAACHADFRG